MKWIFFVLLLNLGLASVVSGTESQPWNWQIKPSVCLTALPEQMCEMRISITLPDQLDGEHCLFSDDIQLVCWQSPPRRYAFQLSLSENTRLELRTPQDDTVFSQTLQVKARSSGRLRRRVRQPWSIF